MKTGDIVHLGPHRLMCGDSGDPSHVEQLFDGKKPDLVFTSPPYAQQRDYKSKILDWDGLMQRTFGAMPHHERTQVLVNLGLVHNKNEWHDYWDGWIEWMRSQGWKRFGWYVWDKNSSLPGDWRGRLAPRFEFVFHFNKTSRWPNKTVPCVTSRRTRPQLRERNGQCRGKEILTASKVRIPDSIFTISPYEQLRHGHPAAFPVALPSEIYKAYTDPGELVFDPFVGSGTSFIAAEQTGRVAYGMEIAPEYCQIAIDRWEKFKEKVGR